MTAAVHIGLFGLGCVGQGVVTILRRNPKIDPVFHVFVRDSSKDRGPGFGSDEADLKFHASVDEVFQQPLDVVVEVMGGTEGVALAVITRALKTGVPLVTANKALIAEHLDELEALIEEKKSPFFFEASVCGGVPVIRMLRSLQNKNYDPISRVEGIVNGSTNYFLWKMDQDPSLDYMSLIVDMTSKGYLEADPSNDMDGFDARSKLIILSRLAFGSTLTNDDVFCVGVPGVQKGDLQFIHSHYNGKIRLMARAQLVAPNQLVAIVMPTIVSATSIFAGTEANFNTIEIESEYAGVVTLKGQGAGSLPTGQAVCHDIIAALSGQQTLSGFPSKNTDMQVATWLARDKFYLSAETCLKDLSALLSDLKPSEVLVDSLHLTRVEFSAPYHHIRNWTRMLEEKGISYICLRVDI